MRWKTLIPVIFLALVLLVACACGGGGAAPTPTPTPTATTTPTPTPKPTPAYKTYTDAVKGFSISYPEDWVKISKALYEEGILVCYYHPSTCGASFSVARELPVSKGLQAYYKQEKQRVEAVEGYTFISEEELTIGGRSAIKIVYKLSIEGVSAKLMHVLFVEARTAWVITCASAKLCWGKYKKKFDTIINSFQLLD